MSVFVFPLGAESVSYSPLAHIYKRCGPSKLDILGLVFLVQEAQSLGTLMWGLDSSLLGENLCNCDYLPYVDH